AIADVVEVLQGLRDGGITEEELSDVRSFLLGSFARQYESPQSIANAISTLVTFGLPDNYYEGSREAIEGVTLEDAAAAAEYIEPDGLVIVVVGDAEKLHQPLVDAEFGTVAVIEDPENGEPPTN
ncbi:MAG: insulinase family protein, partial [Actinobacteria bacterium]|nr:insulinase family protein [Actinomycetota bacterium]